MLKLHDFWQVVFTISWISVPLPNPMVLPAQWKVSSQLFWASLVVSVSDEAFLLIRLQRKKCWVNRTELQLRGDRLGHRAHRGDAGERGKTIMLSTSHLNLYSHYFVWKVMTPVTIQIILCRTSESEDIREFECKFVYKFHVV